MDLNYGQLCAFTLCGFKMFLAAKQHTPNRIAIASTEHIPGVDPALDSQEIHESISTDSVNYLIKSRLRLHNNHDGVP